MSGKFASHDPKMISVFEVVASYFVDTFYNHVYKSAVANVTNGGSKTDEFVRRVQAYMIGVKGDKNSYGDVIQGVHRHFTSSTRYNALNFGGFVDRVVGNCMPEDYFRQLSDQDKDEILSSVVNDLISNLASFATKPDMLRRIIDEHNNGADTTTIRMLQDAAVNALIAKRASMYNKFIRKAGQARDHISMDVVDDMKKALRRLVKEKSDAVSRAEDAEEAVEALKKQVREGKAREAKMYKLIELLRQGRDHGPNIAGSNLQVPARETIAEDDPLEHRQGPAVPRRERIAERRRPGEVSSSESEENDDDEADEEENNNRKNGRRTRVTRKKPGVGADFFKSAAASSKTPPTRPPPSAPTATATAAAPATPVRQHPPMMASLLDNTVDFTGNSELDDILGFAVPAKQ